MWIFRPSARLVISGDLNISITALLMFGPNAGALIVCTDAGNSTLPALLKGGAENLISVVASDSDTGDNHFCLAASWPGVRCELQKTRVTFSASGICL